MSKLLKKIDNLFTVKRTKQTPGRIFITFCILLMVVASVPIYFIYEDYTYGKYKEEYYLVKQHIESYKQLEGNYPIGKPIDWKEEKDLALFFEENHLSRDKRLYYIDDSSIPQIRELKYTFIIDVDRGTLYTSEFVVYYFRRLHLANR